MTSHEGDAADRENDLRMAEILAADESAPSRVRKELQAEVAEESEELVDRLDAMDFIDSVVGEIPEIPTDLGDYQITGLLGRGGMGTVFQAYQPSLDREVALKVLSPAYSSDSKMREQFRSEARATASLHHQHIVPIYDYGEAAGMLFFAMERVHGVSLDKHIGVSRHAGKAAMEPCEAAVKFAGVAEALAHAHKRKLLHRDVKPGNILINPDGTLALADFGLSKVLGDVTLNLSGQGSFAGTLMYTPPEQVRGEAVTPAGDLYSLGVTIFETVSHRLPLEGNTTEAMLDALLNATPHRLREFVPGAPKDLEAVLDKLLSKDPSDRYADGEELARDLRRVADGEPVRIRRQPLVVRAWRRARKNPSLTTAVVAIGILALLVLGLLRSNFVERRKSVELRHAVLLQDAMAEAMSEAGPAQGPPGLLRALTGHEVRRDILAEGVLKPLRSAEELLPEDPLAGRIRRSYLEDPHARATEFIVRGSGREARLLYDEALEEAGTGSAALDDANRLRLFRLHTARAVASLTSSVARPDDALMDLVRAEMDRPGAFFPRLLRAFVTWNPGEGASSLTASVEHIVSGGPDGADEVAGWLLLTFSGVRRPPKANLMEFDLDYAARKELFSAAKGWLGDRLPLSGVQGRTGFEQEFVDVARSCLQARSESPELIKSLKLGEALLGSIHPGSPLSSWRYVYNLLGAPGSPSWVPGMGERLLPELQARAWRDLLRLSPPVSFFRSRCQKRIEKLFDQYPHEVFVPELRALMLARMGSGDQALAAAEAWYESDPASTAALECRFLAELRMGKSDAASFTAVLILQRSVDPASARSRIHKLLDDILGGPEVGAHADEWRRLKSDLELR